jgi:very-short-patch-repair endonuclease
VIAHHQLLRLGLSASAIQKRVLGGRLHPIYRGVYAVGHSLLGSKGRLMAAALAGGPDALISHRSAAALHGLLDDSRAVIDVVSPTHRRSRKGIKFHQSRQLDRAEVDRIPVTSVARTLLDIAPVVPKRRLVYALEQLEKQWTFDLTAIESVMSRCRGHKGLKRLRQALQEIDPEAQYAHEGLERRFIAFCKRYGVQRPAMNAVVEGLTVDALWAQPKLIVQLDSWEHHKDRRAFEEDRRRDTVLALAGFQVLRVTDRQLTEELAATLDALLSRS